MKRWTLTEEQLLAQSADEYMNADQLAFFKGRLLAKAETIKERIRANQQLCQIEEYRRAMRDRGRELDGEQAASEWIAQHAEEFARAFETRPTGDLGSRPAP